MIAAWVIMAVLIPLAVLGAYIIACSVLAAIFGLIKYGMEIHGEEE